ncbi:MAG: sugar phosphate isomerase/epimerase [Clostridiales bacterium]|nr:sugar phosphate isomerase/epimerase [Clostridiales bacterium]
MKLSVFNPVLAALSLEDTLKYLKSLDVNVLELGCGGYPGTAHADVIELQKSPARTGELKNLFEKYGMEIGALSVHGNCVHPDKKIADTATKELDAAFEVAGRLGVRHIVTFSGCPGDQTSKSPNWVTCSWPSDFSSLLEWQWNEKLIPFWKEKEKAARQAGVKVCFEMHPGFCVYNPSTLLRLRKATGAGIGANFDPSHLIWQGIDPAEAIKYLGEAVYYFHAKDTYLNKSEIAVNGVLDQKPYTNEQDRSWIFRTVGYGNGDFKAMISALRMVGYDHVISIEHEDSLMTPKEGLEKAVAYLKSVIIFDSTKTAAWWV